MTHEFYLAEIEVEGNKNFITEPDLAVLKRKVLDAIINQCVEGGHNTRVKKFRVSNSEDFIADYEEDDFQEKIDEVISYLEEKGVSTTVTFIQMTTNTNESQLEEVNWDFI